MYAILSKLDKIESMLQPSLQPSYRSSASDPRFRSVMKKLLENSLVELLMNMCPTRSWGNIWNWELIFAKSLVDDVKEGKLEGLKSASPKQIQKIEDYMYCYFILRDASV